MTKKATGAVTIGATSVEAHGLTTSTVEGRRCCSQCDTWKPLESFDAWSAICRVCKAKALR